jgi:hypothetical protein
MAFSVALNVAPVISIIISEGNSSLSQYCFIILFKANCAKLVWIEKQLKCSIERENTGNSKKEVLFMLSQ